MLLVTSIGLLISTLLIARAQAKTKTAYEQEQQKSTEAHQQRTRADRRFKQAREAVDFLTRIANQELANQPDVRREMLEAALGYYQGFLDERENDPAINNEIAAAQSHVSGILRELAAGSEFGRLMFLSGRLKDPAVRAELHLNPLPPSAPDPLGIDFRKLIFSRDWRDLSAEQRSQRLTAAAQEAEDRLNEILTPEQIERLKQISRQARGPNAFTDPDVVAALGLSRDKQERIRSIIAELRPWQRGGGPGGKGGPGGGGRGDRGGDRGGN